MARLICLPQVWRKRERERARKIESYKGIYQLQLSKRTCALYFFFYSDISQGRRRKRRREGKGLVCLAAASPSRQSSRRRVAWEKEGEEEKRKKKYIYSSDRSSTLTTKAINRSAARIYLYLYIDDSYTLYTQQLVQLFSFFLPLLPVCLVSTQSVCDVIFFDELFLLRALLASNVGKNEKRRARAAPGFIAWQFQTRLQTQDYVIISVIHSEDNSIHTYITYRRYMYTHTIFFFF